MQVVGRDFDRGKSAPKADKLVTGLDKWKAVCKSMAKVMDAGGAVSLQEMMRTLRDGKVKAFSGEFRDYMSTGFVRQVVLAAGKKLSETEEDWKYLLNMTSSVRRKLEAYGVDDFVKMREACGDLKTRLEVQRYGMVDLVVFSCLASSPQPDE